MVSNGRNAVPSTIWGILTTKTDYLTLLIFLILHPASHGKSGRCVILRQTKYAQLFLHHFVCSVHFPTVQKHTGIGIIPHFYWKNDKGVEPANGIQPAFCGDFVTSCLTGPLSLTHVKALRMFCFRGKFRNEDYERVLTKLNKSFDEITRVSQRIKLTYSKLLSVGRNPFSPTYDALHRASTQLYPRCRRPLGTPPVRVGAPIRAYYSPARRFRISTTQTCNHHTKD